MLPHRYLFSFAAFLGLCTLCPAARATFSIVATEPATGTIASAGASCVPYEVIRILSVANGQGLLVAQAYFDDDALAKGQSMLAAKEPPASVLATITDSAQYPLAPKMQYGIVDIAGNTASYTGPEALAFASDKAGENKGVAFTVQGNILTSSNVIDQMTTAMTEGCDLPERIVRGLEAAGLHGEGDSRCTDGGISAASAYIFVEQKGQTILKISLPDVRPNDPLRQLRSQFDAWRMAHPCPEPFDPGQTNPETSPACSIAQKPMAVKRDWISFVVAILGLSRRRRK